MNKVDLSQEQDHLFGDAQFIKAHRAAIERACEIDREFEQALMDHQPLILARLLHEQMALYGWTADEIQAAMVCPSAQAGTV